MPRTEAEGLSKAPLKLTLGEKDYLVPILTVIPVGKWRALLYDKLADIVSTFKFVEVATGEAVGNGLTQALIQFPERVADLVFLYREYGAIWLALRKENLELEELVSKFTAAIAEKIPEAPDFPRSLVLDASEEQFAAAFAQIMQVAFPYLPSLEMTKKVIRSLPQPTPATARPSN